MIPTNRPTCFLVAIAVTGIAPASLLAQSPHAAGLAPTVRLTGKIREYLEARARANQFSGMVLIARDGRPLFQQGYGRANYASGALNTATTKFRLGSLGKQFTASAILLLESQGRLTVTDPVSKFFEDWPPAWASVTISHLLSHTGGLPRLTTQALVDISGLSRPAPAPGFRSIRQLMKPGEELQPLDFTPGEKFAYNNVGFIVLGMIVEKVSGKPYCGFLRTEIFRPAGMADTDCEDPTAIVERKADGYTRVDTTLLNAPYVDMRFPAGAGQSSSTTSDLLLWDRALTTGRVLPDAQRAKLFVPHLANYAYGWWVEQKFGRRVYWHRGNIPGFVAIMARYPEQGLMIAVLSNVDRAPVRPMSIELAAITFGEKYELPRVHTRAPVDPSTYDGLVGRYTRNGRPADSLELVRDGNRLIARVNTGAGEFELFPETATQFFASWGEYYLTFTRDNAGRAAGIVIRYEGEEFAWTRSQ